MSQSELDRGNQHEPLLPIERKLIGYSLGIGIVLLALLTIATRFAGF